jgi:transposase
LIGDARGVRLIRSWPCSHSFFPVSFCVHAIPVRSKLLCMPDASKLPNDVENLKRLILEQQATIEVAHAELADVRLVVEKLRFELARLKRQAFGRSSEALDAKIAQLEFTLEDLEAAQSARSLPPLSILRAPTPPVRHPLPAQLPREEIVHAAPCTCPTCGGALHAAGEDVAEMLEWVPARYKVIRHVRPKFACAQCETLVQSPAPSRPIARGLAGPGLLAHVLVSKYTDHLPLYRQSQIFARDGIDLDRSTLADWVGGASRLLHPLVDAVSRYVFEGHKVHADDTPVPVLCPGRGTTKHGRLWTYVRDDRPAGSREPAAVLFRYSPDRKGQWPSYQLREFTGILQADGYAGFDRLYGERIREAACWAHMRRKFYDIHTAQTSPIAAEALARIARLYAIEADIRGRPPDERCTVRQTRAGPELHSLHVAACHARERIEEKRAVSCHSLRAVALGRTDSLLR